MTKKKRLLEWVTAEDGEKESKNNLFYIYQKMFINIVFGILFIFSKTVAFKTIGVGFVMAPLVAFFISKEKNASLW